jgi:predicted Zn-dependent protease
VELAPDLTEARLGLAALLSKLGRVREAVSHYELARRQQPTNPAILLGLARCRFDSCEVEEARQLLELLLAAQPDHVAGLVEWARLAFRRGQPAEAKTRLERAVALAPWHREAHELLRLCAEELAMSDAAQDCEARLRALHAGEVQGAKLSLRFKTAPRDPALRYELGTWSLRNGQEPAGVRWLFTSLLVSPHYAPTHAALADHFERSGQPRRAALHRQLAQAGGAGGRP